MPQFDVHTNKPVAIDSPDHITPHGTKNDNSKNIMFNMKVDSLYARDPLWILDLGCSGGGFIKSCIEDGHHGVGLEGSDYSKKHKRAEWATIPNNLFTCDITAPFRITATENGEETDARFDLITSWECLEHIRSDDLPQVCENIKAHLKPHGLFIGSISSNEEIIDGTVLHQSVHPQEWWLDLFRKHGLIHHPDIVAYFGNDWIRGPRQFAPRSWHVALSTSLEIPRPLRDFEYTLDQAFAGILQAVNSGNTDYALHLCERFRHDHNTDVRLISLHAICILSHWINIDPQNTFPKKVMDMFG